MKAKLQRTLTLATITNQLNDFDLIQARLNLAVWVGSHIKISGVITKVARRESVCRLVIQTSATARQMAAFANFAAIEKSRVKFKLLKIRKGATVSITGLFQTVGVDAVCLSDCKIN